MTSELKTGCVHMTKHLRIFKNKISEFKIAPNYLPNSLALYCFCFQQEVVFKTYLGERK